MKKSDLEQDYDLLQKENAALKATVVDFTRNLQKLGFFEPEGTVPGNGLKIVFDTSYGKRHKIMIYIVELMSKGLIENTEKSLFEFLSETTNLGSVMAIRNMYYRCQREYVRKWHCSVIVFLVFPTIYTIFAAEHNHYRYGRRET